MLKNLSVPVLLVGLFFLFSCQKDLQETVLETDDITDSTGVWVLIGKQEQMFDTAFGNTPYILRAGFVYDTVKRTITYKDTIVYTDVINPFYHENINTYDEKGRIIKVVWDGAGILRSERQLYYDSSGLLERVSTGHDGIFTWSRQGSEIIGHYRDTTISGGPYSDGNKIFTLNNNRKLMKVVSISNSSVTGNFHEVAFRDANENVVLLKTYVEENGSLVLRDSILYTRETTHPARFSRFYELLGKGIEWYSNYYGISFIPSPSFYSEYFEYDNSFCNKVVYYTTYTDVNGNSVTVKDIEQDFLTEYDVDKNPVKQTIIFNGEKKLELKFTWKKIKWL